MNIQEREVGLSELRHVCDIAEFAFQNTDELARKEEVIGQARAVRAIEFGLSIKNHGYNIFVSGVPGTGRNSIARSIVKRISQNMPVPDDWCFINNFKDPDRPRAIKLPPERAVSSGTISKNLSSSYKASFPRSLNLRSTRNRSRVS